MIKIKKIISSILVLLICGCDAFKERFNISSTFQPKSSDTTIRGKNNPYLKNGYYKKNGLQRKKASVDNHKIEETEERVSSSKVDSMELTNNVYLEDILFNPRGSKVAVGVKKSYYNNDSIGVIHGIDDSELIGDNQIACMESAMDNSSTSLNNIAGSAGSSFCKNYPRLKFNIGQIIMSESAFVDLEDWNDDNFNHAIKSFIKGCDAFTATQDVKSKYLNLGPSSSWIKLCQIGKDYLKRNVSKRFFENYFTPFMINKSGNSFNDELVHFSGNHTPQVRCSKYRNDTYKYPVYRTPDECKDQTKPCWTRRQIAGGTLDDRGLELFWCTNYMDIVMLQVENGGIVILEDNKGHVFAEVDSKNGHPETSIKQCIDRSRFIDKLGLKYSEAISYFNQNNNMAIEVINCNNEYSFFKELYKKNSIVNEKNISMTSTRSITTNFDYIPANIPIWIETNLPLIDRQSTTKEKKQLLDFNRLLVAQQGDESLSPTDFRIYFGYGKKAEYLSKNMDYKGRAYILLPNFTIYHILKDNSIVGKKRKINYSI